METATEHKLQSLIQMYREGYRNPTIDQSIDKLVALEIARLEKERERIKVRLLTFEQTYGMASAVFYEKFQFGALGDDMQPDAHGTYVANNFVVTGWANYIQPKR